MEDAQLYHGLECEEEQWEEHYPPYDDDISEASEEEASPDSHISVETETDHTDEDSDTESSCLCGGAEQPPQDNLKLCYSAGTADLNGHGALHEQLPVGEGSCCVTLMVQLICCCCPIAWLAASMIRLL
jgi:hypothetical protein